MLGSTASPSAASAPPFVGPTPPDRVTMTFGDYLEGVLTVLRTRELTGEEWMQYRAFKEAEQNILMELAGQQQSMSGPQPNPAGANGESEDYGSGFGETIPGMEE